MHNSRQFLGTDAAVDREMSYYDSEIAFYKLSYVFSSGLQEA